jgi:hypothetical protein
MVTAPSSPSMTRILRTWFPPVSLCLLLQATIVAGGVLLNRWAVPETPCCESPLEL